MEELPIYQINQFKNAKRSGRLYASDLSNHLKEHDFITTPHKHNFCLLVLFTQGKGEHEIDFNTYPVEPGSIFILKPGQVHNWKLSKDIEGYIFFHTKDYYDLVFSDHRLYDYPFFQNIRSKPLVSLSGKDYERILDLAKKILEEYQSDNLLKYRKICSLLDITYIELTRVYIPSGSKELNTSPYSERIFLFERLVEENFKTLKSPKEYADLMNISTKHLNRICQNTLVKTTSEVISERILLEARRMLVHGKSNINEIATTLGFEDPSYFTRHFKKTSLETPSQFINRYLQNDV
jgi:AraC-like DNA-binding protein